MKHKKERILANMARIEGKIKSMPNDRRADAWKGRIIDFSNQLIVLDLTERLRVSKGGVAISPPSADLSLKGMS